MSTLNERAFRQMPAQYAVFGASGRGLFSRGFFMNLTLANHSGLLE
jgi:hypothetical protein